MTHNKFFISDTHFTHRKIITFANDKGVRLRPFDTIEEMDELIVNNWNSVVRPQDTTYLHGDVVWNRKALPILDRLNGKKVLIKGNHDIFQLKYYTPYFKDIRAYNILPEHGIISSHIPIHPSCMNRWKLNVHGHLHDEILDDDRYMNVCVEQIDYTPVALETVLQRVPVNK